MTKTITGLKKLGLVGALIGSMLPGLSAAEVVPTPDSVRARVEYTDKAMDSTKETVGLSNNGNEFFRVYNIHGDTGDYLTPALTTSLGTVFANTGDKSGVGVEVPIKFGDTKLTLNAEGARNGARRIGAQITQKFGDLSTSLAYDQVHTREGNRNQILMNTIYTMPNDQVGAAFVKSGLGSDLSGNSANAFWCHFGPKEKFGTRTWAKYDWNDDNGNTKLTWSSINAQNPTFSIFSSPWLVDRTASGDMYAMGVVENGLAAERVPLGCRSKEGFVSEISGCITRGEKESQSIKLEGGYTFAPVGGIKSSVTTFYSGSYDILRTLKVLPLVESPSASAVS